MDIERHPMRRGRRLEPITLTAEESNRLAEWTRRHKTSQALAMRARIVLSCQGDRSNGEIAQQLRVTPQTVGKWRTRFARKRLDGLLDEPRPGAPRTIDDAVVGQVIAMTLHEKPREATHWNSLSMAKASGVSQIAVVRIWRAFGLQPHRAETFKLSTDPLVIEKVRDIVGLHLNPPERALVLCVDEKSQSRPWIAHGRSCP
jgi:transposase